MPTYAPSLLKTQFLAFSFAPAPICLGCAYPLPLPPMAYGAEDVREQQDRVDRMEQLYFHDGRHKREHEKHGLYTGLLDSQEPLHDA